MCWENIRKETANYVLEPTLKLNTCDPEKVICSLFTCKMAYESIIFSILGTRITSAVF